MKLAGLQLTVLIFQLFEPFRAFSVLATPCISYSLLIVLDSLKLQLVLDTP